VFHPIKWNNYAVPQNMTQVVIIGAGPTGLTLAMLLAQRGVSVKLIEASRSFRRIFRGEGLMPSGLAAIGQMGLADMVETIPHCTIDAWEFYIESRPIFRVDEPMEGSGPPCTLISQPAFLEAVLERANTCANFEFIQGSAVQDLVWVEGRVSGVKLGDGQTIVADLVIGADGRNSIVRQKANLTLNQDAQNFDILWFKLPSSPSFSENVFYSILRDRDAFGVFQSSDGNLQVGWSLHQDNPIDWQSIDWPEKLAANSPDWLAKHFREHKATIDRPLLFSIVVGRVNQWHVPGCLLLGDSAHPMSPIRAQGINMALRDVIVAVNYLVPCFNGSSPAAIDAVLPKIQADREPEIIQIQKLQQAEVNQAELLRHNPILRHTVSRLAPLLRVGIRKSWRDRQLKLRQGFTPVKLHD
jgi:2-polyprenyl-6-methoxyphenol hydroxylase-like FAD-dependent oxidoreductase